MKYNHEQDSRIPSTGFFVPAEAHDSLTHIDSVHLALHQVAMLVWQI